MFRKARILPAAMLLACLVTLASTQSSAFEQGPALIQAATEPQAAAEEAGAAEEPDVMDEARAVEERDAPPDAVADDNDVPADQPGMADEPIEADKPEAAVEADADEESGADEEPNKLDEPAPPGLSPEMVALRDNLRKALAVVAAQTLNTRDNTPGELIELSLAFGCDASVGYNGPSGKRINALGCLCWNYPCAGYRLLRTAGGPVMARIGYGLQAHPAQFLAVLAQSKVPADYEIQVGEYRGTVADLIDFEKLNCRAGTDLSFALIGLTHYVGDEEGWENDLGEPWSVERLVSEELARSTDTSNSDVTNRLMGLSFAVRRRNERAEPTDGAFLRAQRHVSTFHDFALGVQNSDGSWHPGFFAYQGTSRDTAGTLRSTGHILEWLALSLPQERLQDPRVLRSVVYVVKALRARRSRRSVTSMSLRDVDGLMHAAHALAIYDGRVFPSRATEESAEEEAEAVASRITPE